MGEGPRFQQHARISPRLAVEPGFGWVSPANRSIPRDRESAPDRRHARSVRWRVGSEPSAGQATRAKPHVHNSGWVQSPGAAILRNPQRHADLRPYVQGVMRRFGTTNACTHGMSSTSQTTRTPTRMESRRFRTKRRWHSLCFERARLGPRSQSRPAADGRALARGGFFRSRGEDRRRSRGAGRVGCGLVSTPHGREDP